MAERRMFSKTVINQDRFYDMPLSAQALYFHLGMSADDDGFVSAPKRIARAINAPDDAFKLLIAKGFVIAFESGVIVITDWKINNTIRADRYKPTMYADELAQLGTDNRGCYCLAPSAQPCVNHMATKRGQDGRKLGNPDKDRIDKNRLDKNSIDKNSIDMPNARPGESDVESVLNAYAKHCPNLPQTHVLPEKRRKAIRTALKQLGFEELIHVFDTANSSPFLRGENDRGWKANLDWLLNPSNAAKVSDGVYNGSGVVRPKNSFHNFEQRDIDYDKLLEDEIGLKKRRKKQGDDA
jgi:hypothetical protein